MSRDAVALVISQIGVWIALLVTVQTLTERLALKDFFLLLAFASLLEVIAAWMAMRWLLPVNGGLLLGNLWAWWNSGGGDGTKKRWRRLKKFRPVRRMTSATA